MQRIEKNKLLFLGLSAGFASASLGIGGGAVLVTSLVLALKYDIKKAIGSSLVTAVPITLVGLITHSILNISNIKFHIGFFVIIGSVVGARLGVRAAEKIDSAKLKKLFALLLFFIGLRLIGVVSFPTTAISHVAALPLLMILGLLAGAASALFGIGGGIMLVPCFYLFFGLSMHEAIATSLLVILPTTFVGAFFHKKIKKIDFEIVRFLVPIAPVGAVFGAVCAGILPADVLRVILGIFMIVSSARIFLK